ncbi:Alpha/Beta hydrolase protein [Cladochytrium replicatum]|nr:Alpha/Beta hydrolase protein [Cladochytrium replicatum]
MTSKILLAVIACAVAVNGFSLGLSYKFSTEAITNRTWDTDMAKFFYTSRNGSIIGARNMTIPYYLWSSKLNKDTIIVVPGRGEAMFKYREFVYDFFRNGYNILGIDVSGQGFSSPRPCPGTGLTASYDFNDYSDDLVQIVNLYKKKYAGDSLWPAFLRKTFIFGHSMGGAISALYLTKNPGVVDAAVLSGPMLELGIDDATTNALGQLASTGLCVTLPGESTVPTEADTTINEMNFQAAGTASRVRFVKEKTLEWKVYKDVLLAGNAVSWIYQAVVGPRSARQNANKATDPILILFGKNDSFVLASGAQQFCEGKVPGRNQTYPRAPNCKLIMYDDARHEVYNERDFIRTPALTAALDFYRRH